MKTATLLDLARHELVQLEQEGRDVQPAAEALQRAAAAPQPRCRALLQRFFSMASVLPVRPDWPYHEPSELAAIKRARPDGPRRLVGSLPDDIADRILGAWLGRCAGCMLGKPVEGRTKDQIAALLRAAGQDELAHYLPPLPDEVWRETIGAVPDRRLLRGNIAAAVRDDDTDYTILGLHILEERGPDFSPRDVAAQWLDHLPYHRVYTAERAAYRNFVMEISPPESAIHLNPFREWIGAQIRADAWGYAAAGWPEKAAELAWRDASISHTKNGIYGEMFFAALIGAALVCDDLQTAIAAAAAEIPADSRLRRVVDDCLRWCSEDSDWQTTWQRINEKYGHYHPVHTLNNAAVVLMGLLHSRGDFGRAVCIAVMGGWDTDCNGATAGSVMGALLGGSGLPARWVEPLADTLESSLEGMTVNRISDLARRSVAVAERIARAG